MPIYTSTHTHAHTLPLSLTEPCEPCALSPLACPLGTCYCVGRIREEEQRDDCFGSAVRRRMAKKRCCQIWYGRDALYKGGRGIIKRHDDSCPRMTQVFPLGCRSPTAGRLWLMEGSRGHAKQIHVRAKARDLHPNTGKQRAWMCTSPIKYNMFKGCMRPFFLILCFPIFCNLMARYHRNEPKP